MRIIPSASLSIHVCYRPRRNGDVPPGDGKVAELVFPQIFYDHSYWRRGPSQQGSYLVGGNNHCLHRRNLLPCKNLSPPTRGLPYHWGARAARLSTLGDAAIEGMLGRLGPLTLVIPPADCLRFNEDLQGNFRGRRVEFSKTSMARIERDKCWRAAQ